MSWITITEALVEDRLSAAELSSLKTVSISDGGTPLTDVISSVTNEIRGYCGAGGYTLGSAGTLPDELQEAAVTIIRHRLALRLNAPNLINEDRRADYRDTLTMLRELVATGKFGIVAPATAATDQPAQPGPSTDNDITLNFDRDAQEGI